jgi:hypothetical protein
MSTRWDENVTAMPPRSERPVGTLFADLAHAAGRLMRQEIALAKAEAAEGIGQVGSGAALLIAGGFIAYAGFLALLAAAILGLDHVLQPWLSALVVGGVVVLVGLGLLLKGRRDVRPAHLVPERTLKTLRDDAQWARGQMQ